MKSEDQICSAVVKKLWNELPQTQFCLVHVPNEANRSKIEWVQMLSKGLIAGAQDYYFLWAGKCYQIEMKDQDGKISSHQAVLHCAHYHQKIPTFVFRNEDDFYNFVNDIVAIGHDACKKYMSFISPYCYGDLKELIKESNRVKLKNREARNKRLKNHGV